MGKAFNRKVKKPLALLVSNNRNHWLFAKMAKWSRSYLKVYENNNNDHHTNGERRVLRILQELQAKVIFDVGANVGDWATIAADENPSRQIYCFEPIPSTFQCLNQKIQNQSAIKAFNFGLSDEKGQKTLLFKPGHSLFSSEISFEVDKSILERIDVQMQKGDDFCGLHKIDQIDFLKIDVEGAEPKVLEGFRGMLEKGAIKSLQFEYGRFNIVTKFLLKDFYEYLEPLGYTIGKVYPKTVEFRPYHISMEDFLGLNYLAVHKSVSDNWIPELRG